MDSQLPSNQEPQQNQITPEQLQQMKMMARQQAMQQVIQQRQAGEQQKIVFAEIIPPLQTYLLTPIFSF